MHLIDLNTFGICFVYSSSFCKFLTRRVRELCYFIFKGRTLLNKTRFLSPHQRLLRYMTFVCLVLCQVCCWWLWNLDISICFLGLVPDPISLSLLISCDPEGGCFISSVLFRIVFSSNAFCGFRETGDYFLCILVVVCHEGSVGSQHKLAYRNISALSSTFKLTVIDIPGLKSVKASDKTIERKIENSVEVITQPCFTTFSTSNGFECSSLKLAGVFSSFCKTNTWLTKSSKYPSFHGMFYKVDQSRKRSAPSPTPRCYSFSKESLLLALDFGHQLFFIYILGASYFWEDHFQEL